MRIQREERAWLSLLSCLSFSRAGLVDEAWGSGRTATSLLFCSAAHESCGGLYHNRQLHFRPETPQNIGNAGKTTAWP